MNLNKIAERLFIKLEEWCSANKLTINIDKTNCNIFIHRDKCITWNIVSAF